MQINIKHCNNINEGSIEIIENRLNIKYALNGTGKSTIAKAISLAIKDATLDILRPFKYKDNQNITPSISGIDKLSKVLVFNEEYLNTILFQKIELIKNSFEIFIKDEDYIKNQEKIEKLVNEVKNLFTQNETIKDIGQVLQNFIDDFKATKTGWAANGTMGKGLAKGNKLENIPMGLEVYEPFLKSENTIRWLKWHITGNDYLSIGKCCPFCSSDTIEAKKEIIQKIKKEYEPKYIEHLVKMIELLEKLSIFLSDDTKTQINKIKINIDGISPEQKNYLIAVNGDIETLHGKILEMQRIGYQSFKDIDDIVASLSSLKIDLPLLKNLNSTKMSESINSINAAIDELIKKAGNLKGEITKQKNLIVKKVNFYKKDINDFLEYAGYNYKVDMIEKDEESRLVLYHNEFNEIITSGSETLSYGERNAFALILFMYDAIKQNPDLIILDDPISSFDGNKKFAILNKLFIGRKNFHDKTVLLLSHDFSIVIDSIYNLNDKIGAKAFFLENRNGYIVEKDITKSDILSYKQIALKNISSKSILTSLIYLRRLFEFENEKNMGYQLLSNLFHKRNIPIINKEKAYIPMTKEEITKGEKEIQCYIADFTYKNSIEIIRNNAKLLEAYHNTSVGYEKLQCYRLLNLENPEDGDFEDKQIQEIDNVFKKFINETFHIENDYLFQINPIKYEIIPEYILNKCDVGIKDYDGINPDCEIKNLMQVDDKIEIYDTQDKIHEVIEQHLGDMITEKFARQKKKTGKEQTNKMQLLLFDDISIT